MMRIAGLTKTSQRNPELTAKLALGTTHTSDASSHQAYSINEYAKTDLFFK